LAEARFLLGDKMFEEFSSRPVGDQERALDEEWKKLDPTPETSLNEAYEIFMSRLAFVNQHYGDFGPAVFDPRGQLYMRLGAPDEVIQDVIPLNRESVGEAIKLIEDRFHAMSLSTHGVKLHNRETTRNEVIDPRELSTERAGDNVAYPFELWVYQGTGEPILERDHVPEMEIGMRYLFIDREGYGRYKLESSSSISTK
jgi:GWxTD domain-containing protein